MLHTIEDTPNLGAHRYPSAALYSVVRQNLLALDQATRIGRSAYCGGQGHPQEYVNENPFRKSRGAFRYLPGMTTLATVVRVTGYQAGDSLRTYINGSLVQTAALANGDVTVAYTLGSFAINSAVEVEYHIYSAARPSLPTQTIWNALFEIIDAYVSPVTLADAWPGVPTFAGSYSAANLTQLANAVDWLIRRVGRRTDPLFLSIIRRFGPYGPTVEEPEGNPVRWYGTVNTTFAAPILKAMGQVWVLNGTTEEIRLVVNGAIVATYNVPTTAGRYNWSLSYTLPQAAGTRVYVEVYFRRLANPTVNTTEWVNRWSLVRVWTEGTAGIYSLPSIATLSPRTNYTWATFKAALNACATAAQTIKDRIDANATLWSRQYLYRGAYGYDEYQDSVFESNYIPATPRVGEAVLIRGINNHVGWGAQVFDESKENEVGSYALNAIYKETVNQGEARATAMVYMDALAGLPPGAYYNVRGNPLTYAGEIWKVGSDV